MAAFRGPPTWEAVAVSVQQVNRRRRTAVCVSCPACSAPVPVLARCVDGDVEAVLECRTCGWFRPARAEDPLH
jgi:Zn ribbon nucleic-acid-binding protein